MGLGPNVLALYHQLKILGRFDGVTDPSIVRFTEGLILDHVLVNNRPVRALA